MDTPTPNPILLYDGVCGLCNRVVQFTLRHDREAVFHFAALQSELASRILTRHGEAASDLNTVYVVLDFDQPGEQLLARSDAVICLLRTLGRRWRVLSAAYGLLPLALRDALYNLVARNRYRVFGKFEVCPLPAPELRGRFLR